MQTNNLKNKPFNQCLHGLQLPVQVEAGQTTLDLAISNFFKCYSLEETEDRLFRMLEEWIYDNGSKQSVSQADEASAFITCLKSLLNVTLNPNLKTSCSVTREIKVLVDGFGEEGTQEMLDVFLESWFFEKQLDPKLLDIANNVSHTRDLIKVTRELAKEGGLSC